MKNFRIFKPITQSSQTFPHLFTNYMLCKSLKIYNRNMLTRSILVTSIEWIINPLRRTNELLLFFIISPIIFSTFRIFHKVLTTSEGWGGRGREWEKP